MEIKSEVKKVRKGTRGFFREFKEFISQGNVIDLAVGVIIGAAFKDLVTGLVNKIFTPIINCLGSAKGENQIKQLVIPLGHSGQSIMIGDFISDIISFIIMAFIVFLLVKSIRKISSIGRKKEIVKVKVCPYCKSEIDIEASRCPNCTSDLTQQEEEKEDKQ
jgi:large conductance mechanosensitive channel